MARRRNITPRGLDKIELHALAQEDKAFYGLDSVSAAFSDSVDSDPEPPQKQQWGCLCVLQSRPVFQDVHGFGHHTLRSLQECVEVHQVTPRDHGAKGRIAHNVLPTADIQDTVKYIHSYANTLSIPHPAALEG